MRPAGSPDLIADRRRRALELVDAGFSLNAAARQVGCAPISVKRWRDERAQRGARVFEVHLPPGRPPRLTDRQLRSLARRLLKGPMANGYRTDLWTTQRIAEVIEREFGVRYHRDHVGRVLKRLGWTHQKPERRATERDEPGIRRWRDERFREIKKTPSGWAPTSSSSTNRASS
jgi:transposase